jgi:hypothetical protein
MPFIDTEKPTPEKKDSIVRSAAGNSLSMLPDRKLKTDPFAPTATSLCTCINEKKHSTDFDVQTTLHAGPI